MLNAISENVADFFIKRNIVPVDDKDIIKYGVEITLSEIIGSLLVLLTSLFFNCFVEGIVFLAMLRLVKRYTGGYHANSYLTCNLCTIGIFLANVLAYKFTEHMPFYIWLALSFVSIIIVGIYAPCEHVNHPLTDYEKKLYKKVSILVNICILILASALYALYFKIFSFVILVQITICINLILGIKTGGTTNGQFI